MNFNEVEKFLSKISEEIKKKFTNPDGTLRLHDLLSWYYSQEQDNNSISKGLF